MNSHNPKQSLLRLLSGTSRSKSAEETYLEASASSSNKSLSRNFQHSPEEIKKRLRIDPDGTIYWKVGFRGRRREIEAGALRPNGYLTIGLDGQQYKAHRVAWVLYTGEWPKGFIDHINGVKTDNRRENLREATQTQNSQNRRKAKGISGVVGVSWDNRTQKWNPSIKVNGVKKHLGLFSDLDDAIAARKQAEVKYGFGPPEQ